MKLWERIIDWTWEVAKAALTLGIITAVLAAALFHALGVNPLTR